MCILIFVFTTDRASISLCEYRVKLRSVFFLVRDDMSAGTNLMNSEVLV